MKRVLLQFGILLPAILGCAARGTEIGDFKTFTSKAGRFTAEFPGDPTPTDQDVNTPVGKMTAHTFLLRIGNDFEYLVVYNDPPENLSEEQKKGFSLDGALNGARDGVARTTGSRLVKESNIMLDKWPGREWELAGMGNAAEDFRWRCYYVNRRQYQICVGWLKGNEPPKEVADRFLNSLKILPE
jgi:hypothetical protein